ncbi:hypothetical protein F7734_07320 [Scytonema sp. UIC 10036]|uniref:hypothetical protein n=1 Tax=Scytonema sp. UIC 10036 TaxID=2304196 RepID=UPI0012DA8424|nr:hypothetical protein [Scytonema sp. UIC 10036]MUG92275.1 hypothetical protein [Scytonema sp. UIC 10036]
MPPRKRNKSENDNPNTHESPPKEASDGSSIVTADERGCTQIDTTSTELLQDGVENSKSIDPSLNLLVQQIEKQNSNLSVIVARQFCYKLVQTLVEVMISEPRKFNVLEEFILRASIEFTPPPTLQELASVLGLDLVFVKSTAENLQRFKSLKILETGAIKITPQGQEFYKQGNVSLPPQAKQIYAIADPFAENLTFQFEALPLGLVDLPDLAELVKIEDHLPPLNSLAISDIQQLIQAAGLGLHVPEEGKIVTNFQMIGKPQVCWKTISIFILRDVMEKKHIIQVRRDKQVLEKASNWLIELEAQQKFDLKNLGITISPENTPVTPSTLKAKRQRSTTKKSQK